MVFMPRTTQFAAPGTSTAEGAIRTQVDGIVAHVKDISQASNAPKKEQSHVMGHGFHKKEVELVNSNPSQPPVSSPPVTKQAGCPSRKGEVFPAYSGLLNPISGITLQERDSRPNERLPFPKLKKSEDISNQNYQNSQKEKTSSHRMVTSRSRSMAPVRSYIAQHGAGTQPRLPQLPFAHSDAQHSDGSECLRQDSALLQNASQNQTEPETPYANIGFCFTEENEPIMSRVLMENMQDVEQDIAALQESGVLQAGHRKSRGSGRIRSTAQRAPNKRRKGNEISPTSAGRLASRNAMPLMRSHGSKGTSGVLSRPQTLGPVDTRSPRSLKAAEASSRHTIDRKRQGPEPTHIQVPEMQSENVSSLATASQVPGPNPWGVQQKTQVNLQSYNGLSSNCNHFRSTGQVPRPYRIGKQQLSETNSQPINAFAFNLHQSVMSPMMTQAGLQTATVVPNHPAWNPVMSSQGHIHALQVPLRSRDAGIPAASHLHVATGVGHNIPQAICVPFTSVNPMQQQNGFPQHSRQVPLQRDLRTNNIGPHATWNLTANQPQRQAFIAHNVFPYDPNASASAPSIVLEQPDASLGQTNCEQNLTTAIPQIDLTSTTRETRNVNSSGDGVGYSMQLPGQGTMMHSAVYTPSAVQGMNSDQFFRVKQIERNRANMVIEPEQEHMLNLELISEATEESTAQAHLSGKIRHKQKAQEQMTRISEPMRRRSGEMVETFDQMRNQNRQMGNENEKTGNGRVSLSLRQLSGHHAIRQTRFDLEAHALKAKKSTQDDLVRPVSAAKWQSRASTIELEKELVVENARRTRSSYISENATGKVSRKNTWIGQRADESMTMISPDTQHKEPQPNEEQEENVKERINESTGQERRDTKAASDLKRQRDKVRSARHTASGISYGGNETRQALSRNVSTPSTTVGNTMPNPNDQVPESQGEDGNEKIDGAGGDGSKSATSTRTRSRDQIHRSTKVNSPRTEHINRLDEAAATSTDANSFRQSRSNISPEKASRNESAPLLMTTSRQNNFKSRNGASPGVDTGLGGLVDPAPLSGISAANSSPALSSPITAGSAPQPRSRIQNIPQIRSTSDGGRRIADTFRTSRSAPIWRGILGQSVRGSQSQVCGREMDNDHNEEVVRPKAWDPIGDEEF